MPSLAFCTPAPEVRDEPVVLRVPPGVEEQARELADTLFVFYGASVDSIAYEPGGPLRITLHPGAYVSPVTFQGDRCGGGTVPLPALLRLGAAASRLFITPDSIEMVEVAYSGAPIKVGSVLTGTRTCGGGTGTVYFRPGGPSDPG